MFPQLPGCEPGLQWWKGKKRTVNIRAEAVLSRNHLVLVREYGCHKVSQLGVKR
jgi:hypothetical protein